MNTIRSGAKTIQGFKLPKGLIKLIYSPHAKERLKERTTGNLILAPQYIRFTEDNTVDIKTQNGKVKEATIYLEYKKGIFMFLPIIVGSGTVKTVFFKNVKKDSIKKNFDLKERYENSKEILKIKEFGREESGEEGVRENVVHVSGDLGGKESRWKKLLRIIRRLSRKRA